MFSCWKYKEICKKLTISNYIVPYRYAAEDDSEFAMLKITRYDIPALVIYRNTTDITKSIEAYNYIERKKQQRVSTQNENGKSHQSLQTYSHGTASKH